MNDKRIIPLGKSARADLFYPDGNDQLRAAIPNPIVDEPLAPLGTPVPTIHTPVRSNSAVSSRLHQNLSSARQTIEGSGSRPLACLALAFFTVGVSSLCVVGAFDYIATDWHLSRTATALLVTAFGGTLGLCAPLLQMLVGHWPRRSQILTGISVMATGSMVMALAPNYLVLLAARILMGLGAALASPMILVLGSTLVEPHLQGRALATVMMGMTVASVVSVPVSTWAAAHIGPRSLFASIGFTTFIAVALIAFFVQNHSPGVRVKLAQFVDLARRPANITGLSVVFCSTAGSFVTYTMITPICVTGIQQVHILSRSRFWCMELQESVAI